MPNRIEKLLNYCLPFTITTLVLSLNLSAEPPDGNQLIFTKWTPTFTVPDPVAISFDNTGRAYVTQTQRRKSQDLDIRANRDWIPNDVALQTVADKQAFFRSRLAPALSDSNKRRVRDLNQDGLHDWRDLTVHSEKIWRITDTDGDGIADKPEVFAEGFNTEVTGIAAGVLWHDDHVYATIAPDVWKIPDDNPAKRQVIAHGFGLHIAYAGHDMHGLTVGPDGRLYWSIGDKGISVETPDGKRHHFPNQGGVLRCDFDGSNFEVFAHGLRNVQELAFDEFGNLFGLDNDADFRGEKERFVYIVQDMDAGWRCNYQYRGKAYNPWTAERLWEPANEAQPAYLLPPIQNHLNGPTGFAYNPGTALGPDYRGFFFLSQFSSGRQNAFRVEPDGASFKMVDDHEFARGTALIGLTFGPDGALYGADWGGSWALNQKGAVWKIDNPKFADSAIRRETAALLRNGTAGLRVDALVAQLGHPDQRVRLNAQFELVKRQATDELATVAGSDKHPLLARIHAVWGLGQLHRDGTTANAAVSKALKVAAAPTSPVNLRIQVARWLRECRMPGGDDLIREMIVDDDARLRFHGAMAAAKSRTAAAFPELLAQAVAGRAETPYLRHAFAIAFAGCAHSKQLAELVKFKDTPAQLLAAIALRHQKSPAITAFLQDTNPTILREAAHAIHDDFSIPAALPALGESLMTAKTTDEAFLRRAINANFRLGTPAAAERLARYAAANDNPTAMRHEALDALIDWPMPARLDRVTGRDRPALQPRPSAPVKTALAAVVDELMAATDGGVKQRTLALLAQHDVPLPLELVDQLASNPKIPTEVRIQAAVSLRNQKPAAFRQLRDQLLKDKDAAIRAAMLEIVANGNADDATTILNAALKRPKAALAEQQAALAGLAKQDTAAATATILDWTQRLAAGKLPIDLQLDVELAAAARANNPEITTILSQYRADLPTDFRGQFATTLAGGNPDRGQDLFMNHLAAACIRCHRVDNGPGSTIGPSLRQIGKQKPDYLLESIVAPGAVVAKGYGITTVTLKDDTIVSGTLASETKDQLIVGLPNGKTRTIPRDTIAATTDPISTMPPMGAILTKPEIRDLIAYLKTLR